KLQPALAMQNHCFFNLCRCGYQLHLRFSLDNSAFFAHIVTSGATVKCSHKREPGCRHAACLPPTVAEERPSNRENLVNTSMLNNSRAMASNSHSACIESIYATDALLTGEIRAEDQRDRLHTFGSLGNFKRTDSDRRKRLLWVFLLAGRGFCLNRQRKRPQAR